MAGYGYTYRGYSGYDGDDRSKTSYASDHVCRPVIIDAEGRKRPIVSYNPNRHTESYVTKTDTVIDQVHSPMVTEYKHRSTTMVDPYRNYGVVEDRWRRPSSPVQERPQKVEEFVTKVQTESSRPNKFGFLNASYWRRTPNSTGYNGNTGYGDYGGNRGYGDYSDSSNKEWQKPSGNTIRNDNYDDYYRRNDSSAMEPTMITTGGWARPSHATWSAPPDATLSKPTNDIGTAMEILKEAAKPALVTTPGPYPRFTPVSTVTTRDAYGETIDSREAARRYNNPNLSSQSVENYTGIIDSKEASRKYKGVAV